MPESPVTGIELDLSILVQVQENFITQARIKEVQLEAAVQQLSQENVSLRLQVGDLTGAKADNTEVASNA